MSARPVVSALDPQHQPDRDRVARVLPDQRAQVRFAKEPARTVTRSHQSSPRTDVETLRQLIILMGLEDVLAESG